MLSGRDLVVLSDDFHGLPTSAIHLARLLAKQNRVFWLNTVGRLPRLSLADAGKVLRTVGGWLGRRAAAALPAPAPAARSGLRTLPPGRAPTAGARAGRAAAAHRRFLRAAQRVVRHRPARAPGGLVPALLVRPDRPAALRPGAPDPSGQ